MKYLCGFGYKANLSWRNTLNHWNWEQQYMGKEKFLIYCIIIPLLERKAAEEHFSCF